MQQGNFAPNDLKFGVAAYRDHPPQARSFVTNALTPRHGSNREQVAFTTDPGTVASVLSSLEADEGGDGPEAVADALQMGLRAEWRNGASKVAILITDAPPHGIGEDGDGFPNGCPLRTCPFFWNGPRISLSCHRDRSITRSVLYGQCWDYSRMSIHNSLYSNDNKKCSM